MSRGVPSTSAWRLSENEMQIAVFSLHDNNEDEDGKSTLPFLVTALPHRSIDGLWETLVYEDYTGDHLLCTLTAAVREWHDCPANLDTAWYNTVLLYGPPGSGKTSLAHGLAQRLSIRLSDIYTSAKLLKVDGSAIFSHMYGGTAKEISSLVSTINKLAHAREECEDEPQLIIVLIDEIDKLVPCRKQVARKNEPLDTVRATAEVLTGIDRLRSAINVVWIFTTNLVDDLDPAFVDRCLLREAIKAPVANCIYELLRAELNTRIQRGEILLDHMAESASSHGLQTTGRIINADAATSDIPLIEIPSLKAAKVHQSATLHTVVQMLQHISTLSMGISARHLRGLLKVSHFQCRVYGRPTLQEALTAFEILVRKEVELSPEQDVSSVMAARDVEDCEDADMELPMGDSQQGNGEDISLPIDVNIYSSDL
ncbi:hypothetical protein HBH70_035400 [Parastagonospora nodorum]|nr:hypothetical protein HBH53_017120 [Parastagonospora nodorum]KAH5146924.1 hypothetical protein HBH70_035400 [Parastagonospora nodorum]KAH5449257.1 hypothetical protein HBI30_159190 [Parastagonospora nodorum]KAH5511579.1 hypothetical protein HBI31_030040 [Parastagonospora nodorum]KAH5611366.1 hypothetical protein HBI45_058960 [Parastagonospora nodorum]